MKESTLLEMQNKIDALTRVMQQMINEMNILSTTAMGTLETVKLIPGYDRAIEFLKKESIGCICCPSKEDIFGTIQSIK